MTVGVCFSITLPGAFELGVIPEERTHILPKAPTDLDDVSFRILLILGGRQALGYRVERVAIGSGGFLAPS